MRESVVVGEDDGPQRLTADLFRQRLIGVTNMSKSFCIILDLLTAHDYIPEVRVRKVLQRLISQLDSQANTMPRFVPVGGVLKCHE